MPKLIPERPSRQEVREAIFRIMACAEDEDDEDGTCASLLAKVCKEAKRWPDEKVIVCFGGSKRLTWADVNLAAAYGEYSELLTNLGRKGARTIKKVHQTMAKKHGIDLGTAYERMSRHFGGETRSGNWWSKEGLGPKKAAAKVIAAQCQRSENYIMELWRRYQKESAAIGKLERAVSKELKSKERQFDDRNIEKLANSARFREYLRALTVTAPFEPGLRLRKQPRTTPAQSALCRIAWVAEFLFETNFADLARLFVEMKWPGAAEHLH